MIRPCKFCGEKEHLVVDYYLLKTMHCAVTCHNCWARGPMIDCTDKGAEDVAIDAWNSERTCHRIKIYERSGKRVCSVCGCGLGESCNYCRGCGAKVVEE